MASRTKTTLIPFLLFFFAFLISAGVALSSEEKSPEQRLQECQRVCRRLRFGPERQQECLRQCDKEYEESQQGEEKEGRGGGSDTFNPTDPEKQLQRCQEACQKKRFAPQLKEECLRRCEQEYKKESKRQEEEGESEQKGRERGDEQEQQSSPYFFGRESFRHQVRTQHGQVRVLKKFHEQSELLVGIANYRLAILEANPQTFVMPAHWDADAIFYVISGKGNLNTLQKKKRQSREICEGDVISIQAGTIVYMVNTDSNEKLVIAKLLRPISTPSEFEVFYGLGGRDPESYLWSFSDEIIEAAFNTKRDKLAKLGQQDKGRIFKLSSEQIREIGGGRRPSGESIKAVNIFKKDPTHSNERGQLREVNARDYSPLGDIDVQVSVANLTGGSMIAPFYNSHATKVSLVTQGKGRVQIVCPHLAGRRQEQTREREQHGERREEQQEQEQEQQGGEKHGQRREEEQKQEQSYQAASSEVSTGSVFVVPAGHPTVEIAYEGENLQVVCFEIRAENNQKVFLAGQNNIWKQMDRQAQEVALDVSAKEVEEVFDAQKDRVFLKGPERRERRHNKPLASIFDFAGF